MSEPRRLMEQDELARLLLGSASGDMPSSEGRARARRAALSAAALGVSAGASVGLVTTSAKAAGKFSSSMLLKWLAVASLPAALVGGVVLTQSTSPQRPPPVPVVPSALSPMSTHPSAEAVPAPAPVDSVEDAARESAPATPQKVGSGSSARVAAPSLQTEITRLDAARHALARGDASVLNSYLAEYPRGALREQALWMKISYLDQAGRKSEARALAKRLAASYPGGPFAARARALAAP